MRRREYRSSIGKKVAILSHMAALLSVGWASLLATSAHPASIEFAGRVTKAAQDTIQPDSGTVYTFVDQAGLRVRARNHSRQPARYTFTVNSLAGADMRASVHPRSAFLDPGNEIEITVVVTVSGQVRTPFRVCATSDGTAPHRMCGQYTAMRLR